MKCNFDQIKNKSCCCKEGISNNPVLWSRKKKLEFFEDNLSNMRKQISEIEETIKDLKG